MANNLVAIEPKSFPEYERAVERGGAKLSPMGSEVLGLIWTDYSSPSVLGEMIDANPQLEWVQLPFAGVDAFSEQLDKSVLFTSAKGAYREPVAEHALMLALALGLFITAIVAFSFSSALVRSIWPLFFLGLILIIGIVSSRITWPM